MPLPYLGWAEPWLISQKGNREWHQHQQWLFDGYVAVLRYEPLKKKKSFFTFFYCYKFEQMVLLEHSTSVFLFMAMNITLTKKTTKKSILEQRNSQNSIYQHLRGLPALKEHRVKKNTIHSAPTHFLVCVADIEGYGPEEVQYVILSKALILSASTSISFQSLCNVCSASITSPMHPSTKGFVVFSQSLWAFSSSVVKILNYKEHQAALFQDAVCYSKTIKCLCKALQHIISVLSHGTDCY